MRDHKKLDSVSLDAPSLQEHGAASSARELLYAFIQEHVPQLLGSIRVYVLSFGLAAGDQVQPLAAEILQETVIEALTHADRYMVEKQAMSWLLGISLNMLRRKRAAQHKLSQHELSLGHLAIRRNTEFASEDELLEQLTPSTQYGPEREIESREQVEHLLSLLSENDQHVLRLALLADFQHAGLAAQLGVSSNTARMRLRRALDRLRAALEQQQAETKGE